MQKIGADGKPYGFKGDSHNGGAHWPTFDIKAYSFCEIEDCPCRNYAVWRQQCPNLTPYQRRRLRKRIKSADEWAARVRKELGE